MIAGVETGGTKVVCAVARADAPRDLEHVATFATTTPDETLGAVRSFLDEHSGADGIEALGVASFGPVNVDPSAERYGWVTDSPKIAWRDTDVLAALDPSGAVPTRVVSDVSGAALGEHRWGAGAGRNSLAYATFGTGVGVGLVVGGRVLAGNGHPELGHVLVRRHPLDDFAGVCPFHGDCVEGLASGPAVAARWGADASSLAEPQRELAVGILGWYAAQVAAVVTLAVGTERVVLGGGVMKTPGLLEATRVAFDRVTGGPGAGHGHRIPADEYLVRPALGDHAGVLGALALAHDALRA